MEYIEKTIEYYIEKYWKLKCKSPKVVLINSDSKTLGELFYLKQNNLFTPLRIEFNSKLFNGQYSVQETESVIKHETCHLMCMLLGMPFKDEDRSFKNELKRIGSHESNYFIYKG